MPDFCGYKRRKNGDFQENMYPVHREMVRLFGRHHKQKSADEGEHGSKNRKKKVVISSGLAIKRNPHKVTVY